MIDVIKQLNAKKNEPFPVDESIQTIMLETSQKTVIEQAKQVWKI